MTEDEVYTQPHTNPVIEHLRHIRTREDAFYPNKHIHLGMHACSTWVMKHIIATGIIPGRQWETPNQPHLPQTGDIYYYPITDQTPNPIAVTKEYADLIVPHHAFFEFFGIERPNRQTYTITSSLSDEYMYEITQAAGGDIDALYGLPQTERKFIIKLLLAHCFPQFLSIPEMREQQLEMMYTAHGNSRAIHPGVSAEMVDRQFQGVLTRLIRQIQSASGFILVFAKEQPFPTSPGDDHGDMRIQTGGSGLSYEFITQLIPLGLTAEEFLSKMGS